MAEDDDDESAAYEYCDDFEEYTPEQVHHDLFYHIAAISNLVCKNITLHSNF